MTLYHTLLIVGSLILLFAGGVVFGMFIGLKRGKKDCEDWEQELESWKKNYVFKANQNFARGTKALYKRIEELEQELLQRDLQHPL